MIRTTGEGKVSTDHRSQSINPRIHTDDLPASAESGRKPSASRSLQITLKGLHRWGKTSLSEATLGKEVIPCAFSSVPATFSTSTLFSEAESYFDGAAALSAFFVHPKAAFPSYGRQGNGVSSELSRCYDRGEARCRGFMPPLPWGRRDTQVPRREKDRSVQEAVLVFLGIYSWFWVWCLRPQFVSSFKLEASAVAFPKYPS